MNPDTAGSANAPVRAPHRTSRRIHYWILGFILLLVTASFLFVRWSGRGAVHSRPSAAPHPFLRPGPGWLRPARHFLGRLGRQKKKDRPKPRLGRVGRLHPHRRLAESRQRIRKPARRPRHPVWGSGRVAGRTSPILAWSGPPVSSGSAPPPRRLDQLIRKLEPARSGGQSPAVLGRMVAAWKRQSHLGRETPSHRANRNWLRRERRSRLPQPEVILPRPRHPVLLPGSVIPAVLLSEINSDLPGMIVARVTRTVFDSVRERVPMIPRGATLVGYYSSQVAAGQTRVLASFSEVIFPDGRRVSLAGMQAADAYGASGLKDEVNTHFWKIFGSSFLIAALSALLPTGQSTVVVSPAMPTASVIGPAAGQALLDTSQAILGRNEGIPPTLIIRQGFRFLVMVSRPIAWARGPGRKGRVPRGGPVPGNPVVQSRGLRP